MSDPVASPLSSGLPAARPAVRPAVPAPGALGAALNAFWAERHRPVRTTTLVLCAVVGIAGAALLVGHRPGLGLALVGLLVWAPAVPGMLRRRAWADLVLATLSVALVAVVAVRDAGWVVGLCIAAAVGATAVAATSARSAPAVLLSLAGGAAGLVRALPWMTQGVGDRLGSHRGRLLAGVRTVGVTVGLLVVFGLLFASADRVFASYLPRVQLDRLPAQLVVGVLVALAAATLTHLTLSPPRWSRLALPAARPVRRGEWLMPVLALDALVVAFVLVQVGALVGGHAYVRRTAGLSYAEYARQGFGQLLAATALTLVVVGVAARRAPRESGRDRLLARLALGTLCVATLGVVASALRRMDLYVDAFGMTRLRLLAVVAEVVLAVVLVLVLAAGMRWRGGWLPHAVVQVVAVAMLGLALVNPDAVILRHNTSATLTAPLDVDHLRGLSADAVPAMDRLAEPLRSCLLGTAQVAPAEDLAGWNLGRDRAAAVLGRAGSVSGGGEGGASPCGAYSTMDR